MKKHNFITVLFFMCLFLLSGPAAADLGKIFAGSGGVIVTAGADFWTEPESDYNLESVPFGDLSAGYGVGGGIFFEARFIKYIGLELDFLIEHNKMWYDIEYGGGAAELRYAIKYVNYRLPILVKGVIPTGMVRVSIGVGPEIVLSRHDRSDIEVLKGNVLNLDEIRDRFGTKPQSDVFICAALGFAFKVWKLSIPLNLRYSYNLMQPKDFDDRMNPEIVGFELRSATFVASQSMDLRLMVGVAYDF